MYQVFTTQRFDFNELFVFDLANNHHGSVEHGKTIIQEVANIAKNHGVRGALKFQFRQLDTFIHPAHRSGSDNKHIPRFLSTRLTQKNFVDSLSYLRLLQNQYLPQKHSMSNPNQKLKPPPLSFFIPTNHNARYC